MDQKQPVVRILLVEDDEYISELYVRKLAEEGFDVRVMDDGRSAWELLDRNGFLPDAILLDINMPHKDGMELLRQIRGDIRWNGTVVIVLTNIPSDERSREAFMLGAQDYLEKFSYTPTQIIGKIRETLSRRRTSRQDDADTRSSSNHE